MMLLHANMTAKRTASQVATLHSPASIRHASNEVAHGSAWLCVRTRCNIATYAIWFCLKGYITESISRARNNHNSEIMESSLSVLPIKTSLNLESPSSRTLFFVMQYIDMSTYP